MASHDNIALVATPIGTENLLAAGTRNSLEIEEIQLEISTPATIVGGSTGLQPLVEGIRTPLGASARPIVRILALERLVRRLLDNPKLWTITGLVAFLIGFVLFLNSLMTKYP